MFYRANQRHAAGQEGSITSVVGIPKRWDFGIHSQLVCSFLTIRKEVPRLRNVSDFQTLIFKILALPPAFLLSCSTFQSPEPQLSILPILAIFLVALLI